MKLSAKFNLVLLVIFTVGILLTGGLMYTVLQANARDEVVQRAGLMMQAAQAMRTYTIEEIRPALSWGLRIRAHPLPPPACRKSRSRELPSY